MADIDDLESAVSEIDTVRGSVEAGMVKIAEQIAALKNNQTDPATAARIQAASAALRTNAARIGAAIVSGTVAETEPAPPPA